VEKQPHYSLKRAMMYNKEVEEGVLTERLISLKRKSRKEKSI
jgi:hypothetical protein